MGSGGGGAQVSVWVSKCVYVCMRTCVCVCACLHVYEQSHL